MEKYRVIDENDRTSTVAEFASLEAAQRFTERRGGRYAVSYEIQEAELAEDGSVFAWRRTAESHSRRIWA